MLLEEIRVLTLKPASSLHRQNRLQRANKHCFLNYKFSPPPSKISLLSLRGGGGFMTHEVSSGGGQGGGNPGREARGDGAGCGSHVRVGGGRRMRDIKFFNDF